LVALDGGDDRLGCHHSPVLDRPGMKGAEVGEVPIEAATRDAELAGQHVRLECIRALVRERGQCEIDPVLRRQPSAHTAAPYTAVLTPTMRRHSPSRSTGERGGGERGGASAGFAAGVGCNRLSPTSEGHRGSETWTFAVRA